MFFSSTKHHHHLRLLLLLCLDGLIRTACSVTKSDLFFAMAIANAQCCCPSRQGHQGRQIMISLANPSCLFVYFNWSPSEKDIGIRILVHVFFCNGNCQCTVLAAAHHARVIRVDKYLISLANPSYLFACLFVLIGHLQRKISEYWFTSFFSNDFCLCTVLLPVTIGQQGMQITIFY